MDQTKMAYTFRNISPLCPLKLQSNMNHCLPGVAVAVVVMVTGFGVVFWLAGLALAGCTT